jgi:ketosteroid isomerase-like protein
MSAQPSSDAAAAPDPMSDRSDITQLLATYAHAVDDRDFAAVAACFLPDATASYSGRELGPGVEDIIGHIRGVENFVSTQHLFGVPKIQLDGDTATSTAHAISYLVAQSDGATTVLGRGLAYDDQLVRTTEGWRIARRVHRPLWSTVEPLDWAGSPPAPAQ